MKSLFIILAIAYSPFLWAQGYEVKVLNEQEVDFLFNYYEQNGNHSPVTGGIGSEKLDCMAPMTSVNVPFDTVHSISVNLGIDYYTSASCDQIDRFVTSASSEYISSASSHDMRTHFDVDYTRKSRLYPADYGVMLGYSNEFDVNSFAAGLHYTVASKDENRQLGLKATAYYDVWKLIYPGEIRNGDEYRFGNEEDDYDIDSRLTSTFTATWSQVVTRNLQFLLTGDFVLQKGILHTPFHRVYFDDGFLPFYSDTAYMPMLPENLPRTRIKIPVGIRLNYYLSDWLIMRLYYRYYYDDFGITSNTVSVEFPVKISSWLSVYPLYRFYEQSASKYFAPFGGHLYTASGQPQEEYYTSDFDLSKLVNRKYGAGFRISPTYGIKKWSFGKNTLTFKSFESRYAIYRRSDGLDASSISFNFGFVF